MRKLFATIFLAAIVISGCKSHQKSVTLQPQISALQPELQETQWKLIELMGKPLVLIANNKKDIYLILKNDGKSVLGFSGCNTFMGKYVLMEGKRIAFSAIASTMMACPDLAVETEFAKMLGTVDNYTVNGKTLTLNKARMAPMARFEAVVMK